MPGAEGVLFPTGCCSGWMDPVYFISFVELFNVINNLGEQIPPGSELHYGSLRRECGLTRKISCVGYSFGIKDEKGVSVSLR